MDVNAERPPKRVTKNTYCDRMDDAGESLAFNDDVACDFAARTEGFLRFAVEFGLDAPGVAERQDKLVLAFISGFFSRPEQGLLGTAAIDLNDDPTQLCRLKIECQLPLRSSRPFE